MKELERKFLVDELPAGLQNAHSRVVRQGYLVVDEGKELRIRQVKDQANVDVTIKKGEGILREELTIAIPKTETDHIWDAVQSELRKTRYLLDVVDDNGSPHLAEIDVYAGDLEGLEVVEVEFDESTMNGDEFCPPSWFGEEITDDPKFKNKRLASISYEDLSL